MLSALAEQLRIRIGFDVETIGMSALQHAVRLGQRHAAVANEVVYIRNVLSEPVAWREFLEHLLVPETSFFRHPESFIWLTDWLGPRSRERTLRVLSLACSTGEEPYTLAMTLLGAGWPADRARIEALDLSTGVLERARRAVYTSNSFRGVDEELRRQWFEACGDGCWQVVKPARQLVHFAQANLSAAHFGEGPGVYDLILCRNVMIYFDDETRNRVMTRIRECLRPDGAFITGPAELAFVRACGFVHAGQPKAFAFVMESEAPLPAGPPAAVSPRAYTPKTPAPRRATPPKPVRPSLPAAQTASLTPADARILLDASRFQEALHLLDRLHAATAECSFLRAIALEHLGRAVEAEACLRQALYLDPGHYESLVALASIRRADGRLDEAERLIQRAQRGMKGVH